MAIHDIRGQIPMMTERNKNEVDKPPYEYQEYPKMMLMLCDQKYLDLWMERNQNVDTPTGKIGYRGGRPRIGTLVPILDEANNGILVHDEEEEEAFRTEHPEAHQLRSGPPADQSEVLRLEQEVRDLRLQLADKKPAATAAAKPGVASMVKDGKKPAGKTKPGAKGTLPKDL